MPTGAREAEKASKGVDGKTVQLIRQASNTGQLYGSVSARDIVEALEGEGAKVTKSQIVLDRPIKAIGVHEVKVALHPEVAVTVKVNVARSPEEAELQAQGVDVMAADVRGRGGSVPPRSWRRSARRLEPTAAEEPAAEAPAEEATAEAAEAPAEAAEAPPTRREEEPAERLISLRYAKNWAAGRKTGGLFRACDQRFVASGSERPGTVGQRIWFSDSEHSGGDSRSTAMADERDDEQFGETEGKTGQQTTGQQGQQSEFGKQQGTEPIASGQGSTGNEFGQSKGESAFGETATSGGGQSDLGSQSGTTLAGRADQQDLGQDQPGTTGGATGQTGQQGEGFIGSQGTGSEDI